MRLFAVVLLFLGLQTRTAHCSLRQHMLDALRNNNDKRSNKSLSVSEARDASPSEVTLSHVKWSPVQYNLNMTLRCPKTKKGTLDNDTEGIFDNFFLRCVIL